MSAGVCCLKCGSAIIHTAGRLRFAVIQQDLVFPRFLTWTSKDEVNKQQSPDVKEHSRAQMKQRIKINKI